jgi:hypothetical protein
MIELDAYDAFGGIYVPWYKEGKRSWFLDEYASNEKYLPYTETCELTEKYLCGNNCAFRLAALGTDLRFPADLGMTGNVVYYGEEILVQNQLRRRGFRIGFSPEMTIEHLAPLSKQNLSWIKISSLKSGESNWAATNQAVSIRGILLSILSIPYRLAIELTPALARLLTGRYRPINVYIVIIRIWYNRLGKVRQGLRLLGR